MPMIIEAIIELLVFLAALWILTFLSTLLHELGHAIGYMLATRDKHWHVRVGWGKPLLNTKKVTVNLLVFDGFFTPSERKIDSRTKMIMTLSGGPAVSLLLVAGLLILRLSGLSFQSDFFSDSAVEWFLNYPLFCNLIILLLSLVPGHYLWGKVKGLESDGLQIIHTLNKG
ncbi:MAG: hypothetical protein IJ899_21200 [Blautia sp.]|nr:hypothetical protein [Blautia sp.]